MQVVYSASRLANTDTRFSSACNIEHASVKVAIAERRIYLFHNICYDSIRFMYDPYVPSKAYGKAFLAFHSKHYGKVDIKYVQVQFSRFFKNIRIKVVDSLSSRYDLRPRDFGHSSPRQVPTCRAAEING